MEPKDQDSEIVKLDNSPRMVSVSPNQLRKQMERDQELRQVINEYISSNMVEGKDYGSIEIKGRQSKPSLFKPGAEKFCGLFKIRATFRKDDETLEMLGNTAGIIAYVCELVDSRGQVVGEGRGTAKTDPINGADFDINKQVKIAEKRAQIDAVLRTGGLSDFFTQDMEDAPKDNKSYKTATEKQIKWMRDTAQEVNDQLAGHPEKEIDDWIKSVLTIYPQQVPIFKVGDAVEKLRKPDDLNADLEVPDLSDEGVSQALTDLQEDNLPY